MFLVNFLFIFCALIPFSSAATRSPPTIGCRFKIPADIPENEPVYLQRQGSKYQIYSPADQLNVISPGESLHLFCPGKNNAIQIVDKDTAAHSRGESRVNGGGPNMTELECNLQSKFEVNSGPIQINRLNCTREVMGDLLTTPRRCGPRSEAVINQLGFRVNAANFIPLINACFNNRTASVNFVRYTINGRAIRYNVRESERRTFRENGLPSSIKANDAYKRNNQLTHFKKILGEEQNFFNATSYLSRGHLAADADFVFSSAQFATYFYVNVAPQFQAINAGNWLRVEKIARNLAMTYATDLTIYTGTLGQLKLPSHGKTTVSSQRALYLHSDNKIIVPQFFYKIIVNEDTASAIVFVTSNNPFAHRIAIRPFCEDVCQRAGLDQKQFRDTRKGLTFCCEYEEFMQQVDITPFSHHIQHLLSCANIVLE